MLLKQRDLAHDHRWVLIAKAVWRCSSWPKCWAMYISKGGEFCECCGRRIA